MRTQKSIVPLQSLPEEIANSLTHGVGLVLSVIGLCALVSYASAQGTAWHLVGCTVYGVSLVLLYMASTVYHSWPHTRPGAKEALRILDHACIYLLIAGSYTPFTLTILRGTVGWTLFGLVWTMAVIGIACKICLRKRPGTDYLSTLVYAVMGWLVLLAIKPVLQLFPQGAILWIFIGGILYTLGIVFYLRDHKVPFFHTVWHLFVLGGSASHFYAVMNYVLPSQG